MVVPSGGWHRTHSAGYVGNEHVPGFRHSGEEAAPSESSSLGFSSYRADGNELGGPLTSV